MTGESRKRTQGNNLKEELKQRPYKDAVPCCDPHTLLSFLSRQSQPTCQVWSTHRGLSPLILITNQENAPQVCIKISLVGGIFSVEFPSSQMTLACVQLTEKTNLLQLTK